MKEAGALARRMAGSELFAPAVQLFEENICKPGYKFNRHMYPTAVEIVYSTYGTGYVGIGEQYIGIRKNECLVIFPGVVHDYVVKNNESCRTLDLVFEPGTMEEYHTAGEEGNGLPFLHEIRIGQMKYARFPDDGTLRNLLERIAFQHTSQGAYAKDLLRLYFCELFFILSDRLKASQYQGIQHENHYVRQALAYLANFYTQRITLKEVAESVHISSRHLSRLFLHATGMTVQDYLSLLRIRKAKELLQFSGLSVTDIAHGLGFSSSQYFITCFRRYVQVAPGEYRQSCRKNKL